MPNDTHRHHKPKNWLQNCHKYAYTTLRNLARTVEKWGRQQPPCIIANRFKMCVFVWVFERGSLATPFLPSKMKCLFQTAGEILGAPYESVGTLVKQFWYLLVSGSATRMALLLPRRSPRQAPHLRVGGIGRQASTISKGNHYF